MPPPRLSSSNQTIHHRRRLPKCSASGFHPEKVAIFQSAWLKTLRPQSRTNDGNATKYTRHLQTPLVNSVGGRFDSLRGDATALGDGRRAPQQESAGGRTQRPG